MSNTKDTDAAQMWETCGVKVAGASCYCACNHDNNTLYWPYIGYPIEHKLYSQAQVVANSCKTLLEITNLGAL